MNILTTAALALALSLGAGATYQQLGQAADRQALAPPGRMISVDDGRMHLHCIGHGRPTVLLEAGATGFAQTWAWIQPELANPGRVCTYDRAGLGWSEPLQGGSDGLSAAQRLGALLDAAGETGPYLVVGHSLGGPLVRLFAAQRPDEVVGMVLVDPSHPDQLDHFPADAREQQASFTGLLGLASMASHVGLTRVTNVLGRNAQGLPDVDYRAARMFASSPLHLETSRKELLTWEQTMSQVRASAIATAVPLVVISAGRTMAGMPDGFLPVVHALHRDIAARTAEARHVIIDGADHFSLLMNPSHAAQVASEIASLRERLGREAGSEPKQAPPPVTSAQPADSL